MQFHSITLWLRTASGRKGMRHFSGLSVYYFSGTGNALSASGWIAGNARKAEIETEIRSIEEPGVITAVQHTANHLVAFAFPTHGFAPPWIMIKFLWRFPRMKNAGVIFLNTKGGFKAGRFFIPGVSGLALWFPIILFLFKGYSIRGALPLDMPHSWTSFFPPNGASASVAIANRCHRIVNEMCERLFIGRRYFRFTMFTHLWIDIIAAAIIPAYILAGRFVLAKTLYASGKCNNCRICEEFCPVHAIGIRKNRPYWKYYCENCMRCMNICPKKAIQSWVVKISLAGYLLSVAALTYFNLNNDYLWIILTLLIFPLYPVFDRLSSVRIINLFFTYTSLTSYWRRYLAPGIKTKDLKKHGNTLRNG